MVAKKRTHIECVVCGKMFEVIWFLRNKKKTCSPPCHKEAHRRRMSGNKHAIGHAPNSTSFKKGDVPWNTGTVGVMQSNSGSFKAGEESKKKEPLGTLTIREDKNGKLRAWLKVADNGTSYDWKLRAVVVWEKENGPLPKGCVVHHKDRDSLNDTTNNLQCLTRSEHLLEHRPEFEEKRSNAISKRKEKRHTRGGPGKKPDTVPLDNVL